MTRMDNQALVSLASQRLPMPNVEALQVQVVRYVGPQPGSCYGTWHSQRGSELKGAGSALPAALRFSIVEAPAEWCWPLRTDKCFKPGFKLAVEIAHDEVMDLPLQLAVHLLTEDEMQQLLTWNPTAPGNNTTGPTSGPSAALKGTLTRSVIVEAGKLNSWTTTRRSTNSGSGGAGDPATPANSTGGMQMDALGRPVSTPVQLKPQPAGIQTMTTRPLEAGEYAAMLTREEFVFSDLRFAKPSRMSAVYIAFSLQIQATGDKLIVLYLRPTISTCRAEQWSPACQRLGVTNNLQADNTVSDSLEPSITSGATAHLGPSADPYALPFSSVAITNGVTSPGGRPLQRAGSGVPVPQPHMLLGMANGLQRLHSIQHEAMQLQPLPGFAAANGHLPGGHVHANGQSNGLIMQPSVNGANGVHGLSQPSPVSGLRHMGSSPPVSPAAPALSREVMEWCQENFSSLGLVRGLTQDDLQALVQMSGAQHEPAAVATASVARFKTQFQSLLSFVRYIPTIWNWQSPCIVAGFSVTREAAARILADEPVGTFLCRLSMSSGMGGLSLAVKLGPGQPHVGQEGVLHVLITKKDIERQSVLTILRDYVGTTHLLDVYTGKRVDKRKVFASDYMRLGDILTGSSLLRSSLTQSQQAPRSHSSGMSVQQMPQQSVPVKPDESPTRPSTTSSPSPGLSHTPPPRQAPSSASPMQGLVVPVPSQPMGNGQSANMAAVSMPYAPQQQQTHMHALLPPVPQRSMALPQVHIKQEPTTVVLQRSPAPHPSSLLLPSPPHGPSHNPGGNPALLLQSLQQQQQQHPQQHQHLVLLQSSHPAQLQDVSQQQRQQQQQVVVLLQDGVAAPQQPLLDSSQLDVNMLLDSIPGNQQTMGWVLNTDEQMMAEELLGD